MPIHPDDLNAEAREALEREKRTTYWRSMAIAMGFALPAAVAFRDRTPFLVSWLGFGIPIGLAMPWLHIYVLERLRHRSFVITLLKQSTLYVFTLAVCLSTSLFVVLTWTFLAHGGTWSAAIAKWVQVITSPYFLIALLVAPLLVLPVRFMFALSQKLGPGVLKRWMLGHYHEPREEERIFMFLDMKDSTTLAERLGNLRFSALVRDFFADLTLPVLQTKAEVSHYIGDEVVLTWTMPRGLLKSNCVRLFFEFRKAIARRDLYYRERYGIVPGFKAGAHFGLVVATEVGEIKSEIVFHGDVLNTAARIQGLCASTGDDLLVSDGLAARLTLPESFQTAELGAHALKGKERAVGIVAIRQIGTSP